MVLAHIAGIPIEETALSFGPVIAAGGGIATLKLRERFARRRGRGRQAVATGRRSRKSSSLAQASAEASAYSSNLRSKKE
jgi:hypothetical protein